LKKIELLASTAVMDECESHETLKTNRNSPNRNFIFFYIYLRFGLVCYFLSRQKEQTDAHLLFMRQTYLRSFHFFSFKFQQRKNVAAQLRLYCSFFSFISNSYSLVLPGISLALMSFGEDHAIRGRSFAFRPWRARNKTLY
jgi:uncharacterized membrane protein